MKRSKQNTTNTAKSQVRKRVGSASPKGEPRNFRQVLNQARADPQYRSRLKRLGTKARGGNPLAVAELLTALKITPKELKELVPPGLVGRAAWTTVVIAATVYFSCGFRTSINDHFVCSEAS